MHFADTLLANVRSVRTPLCLGLDPRWELLPLCIRQRHGNTETGRARAYEEFCFRILDIAQNRVAVVKVQSAFFEACGPQGWQALRQVIQGARRRGMLVILDAKRADIASTAEAYAQALYDVYQADAITVNPYLGEDALEPFLKIARQGRGLFILVRTSNRGAKDYQDLICGSKRLYECVAEQVERWAIMTRGKSGFGTVGAVVGATEAEALITLRQRMPTTLFLIPGYGAQGASLETIRAVFQTNSLGAIVNAARSILYAAPIDADNWESHVESALLRSAQELAGAAGWVY
jgi:orotidine-5'-phosphate decarboxylase